MTRSDSTTQLSETSFEMGGGLGYSQGIIHACILPSVLQTVEWQMVYRAFPSEPFEEIGNVIQYSRSSVRGGIYYR